MAIDTLIYNQWVIIIILHNNSIEHKGRTKVFNHLMRTIMFNSEMMIAINNDKNGIWQ